MFKLQQNGIFGNLYQVLKDFLSNRKQRVALNKQVPSWARAAAEIPLVLILGPLFLLIYIIYEKASLQTLS